MRKSGGFTPDIRSEAGRSLIVMEKLAHTKRLATVKPTLDTHAPAPKSMRSGSTSARPASSSRSLSSTSRTLIDASRVKHGVDCAEPQSFRMSRGLSQQRQRRLTATQVHSHEKELQNMQRRIAELDTVAQRKKNPFDATVHPALLMRRAWTPAASLSATVQMELMKSNVNHSPRSKRPMSARSTSSPNYSPSPHQAGNSSPSQHYHSNNNDSTNNNNYQQSSSNNAQNNSMNSSSNYYAQDEYAYGNGSGSGQQMDDEYLQLRDNIVAQIVEERIFQERDLLRLFDERMAVAVQEAGMDRERVQAVIDSLKLEFEVAL